MVRARAGNGMARSRARILGGAARCVARYGTRKTTMGDIAREAGVAKATLYNHFRAKEDVYAALVEAEVDDLLARLAETTAAVQPGSAEAVARAAATAATWLAEHPVVRRLATAEPALLVALLTPAGGEPWTRVRAEAVRRVSLAQAAGALHPRRDAHAAADLLLRWAVSHALWPATVPVADAATTLVAALQTPPAATHTLAPPPHLQAGPARPGADHAPAEPSAATPAPESVDAPVRHAG